MPSPKFRQGWKQNVIHQRIFTCPFQILRLSYGPVLHERAAVSRTYTQKKPFRTYVIYVYLGHLHTRSSTYLLSKIISKSVQAISKILIAKILFILESYKFLACLLLQLHTALSTYNYVNLINNPRMFNLAEKPYIPQKSLLL